MHQIWQNIYAEYSHPVGVGRVGGGRPEQQRQQEDGQGQDQPHGCGRGLGLGRGRGLQPAWRLLGGCSRAAECRGSTPGAHTPPTPSQAATQAKHDVTNLLLKHMCCDALLRHARQDSSDQHCTVRNHFVKNRRPSEAFFFQAPS